MIKYTFERSYLQCISDDFGSSAWHYSKSNDQIFIEGSTWVGPDQKEVDTKHPRTFPVDVCTLLCSLTLLTCLHCQI